jgi:hypothetical protein
MDELLIRVLTRLLRVHEELGDESFEEAAHRALLAIALTVQCDAERKAGVDGRPDASQQVVPFPLAKRRRGTSTEAPDGS